MEAKKWEDTVMTPNQIRDCYWKAGKNPAGYKVAEVQAEISFKAGEGKGKQGGIEKVVEWLKEYAVHGGNTSLCNVLLDMEVHSPFMGNPLKERLENG